jgi:murein DD-endopeptidase MepM/ murein hydrolase activator NlpD
MTTWVLAETAGALWNWRRPLLWVLAVLLGGPLLLGAGLVTSLASTPPGTGGLSLPVRQAVLTQPYGCTSVAIEAWSATCPGHHFHSGIDLANVAGTPIYAVNGGVAVVQDAITGYGLHIIVVRDLQFETLYGHLEVALVQSGDRVVAGQRIALMGSTGNSTGPHLHFEVRLAGVPVDPAPFFPNALWGGDAARH